MEKLHPAPKSVSHMFKQIRMVSQRPKLLIGLTILITEILARITEPPQKEIL